MNNKNWMNAGLIAAGLVALYATLDIERKQRVMNYVRGLTDKLPENIKSVLPTFLLSETGALEKGVHNTAEKLLRVS